MAWPVWLTSMTSLHFDLQANFILKHKQYAAMHISMNIGALIVQILFGQLCC